jgi:hypothetical protein
MTMAGTVTFILAQNLQFIYGLFNGTVSRSVINAPSGRAIGE